MRGEGEELTLGSNVVLRMKGAKECSPDAKCRGRFQRAMSQ